MRTLFAFVGLWVLFTTPACSCDDGSRHNGDSGVGDGGVAIGGIFIMPNDVTLDLVTGQAPPQQAFTVFQHNSDGDKDITGLLQSTDWTLVDTTLGVMNLNVFVCGTAHGGSTTLVASYLGQSAQANIHVKVHGTFTTPDCPGCTFPGTGAPTCGGMDTDPTVIYPSDGVLLPPNMNTITLQWLPGTGNNQFEIDLTNPATDVKIMTKCKATVDTRGAMSGGCQLDLTGAMWDFVAKSNRGGDPVKITVQGTSNGTCASPGANTVAAAFAEEDVSGGIYYWKSTVSTSGTGGQIWRKSFGDTVPEEQITGVNNLGSTCNGCHALSRDGLRMTINSDDDDSDDEYSDTNSGLVDVGMKTLIPPGGFPNGTPGFQAFNQDHTRFLASAGDNSGVDQTGGPNITPNQFFLFDGNNFMRASPNVVTAAPAGKRATMPDWANDDKNAVFVVPTSTATWSNAFGQMQFDDDHILGGSLWTMPHMGGGVFGTPVEILHAPSDLINNYYPSYAPDGSFIVFNRVDVTPGEFSGAPGLPDKVSFSNPHARVFVIQPGQPMPIDCAALNDKGDLSNSWPRWSPFIQKYKGSKLLWVTFSSTRDYGLLVRNSTGGQVQCYPPDTPENLCPASGICHGTPFPGNCKQPQIWMAAINLTTAEVMNQSTDPSSPAFWLPFQDIQTHNHTAQWTSTVVTMPPPDGGACIMGGQDCTHDPNGCCSGLVCTGNGTCGIL